MDKMDKLIKEMALKAEDILNSTVFKCEENTNPTNTNPTTAALNAEFALGEHFALMNIVKAYDMNLYVSVAKSTQEVRNKLLNIANNIYSV